MEAILSLRSNVLAFRELLILLTRHRQLVWEMTRREISDRYVGQFFGIFWAFGHPMIMMLVYVFIFGFVFKIKIGNSVNMPLDYATYLLSGLIPWLAFQESMSKATSVVTGNANLVKQVVFPVEVLPVKGALASLFTQSIFVGILLLYTILGQHHLSWTYLLLPGLFVLQLLAMIGVSYFLSTIGVYFRDIKDFVQVFAMVGVYLIPAFYLPEFVPASFRSLLYLNPFSYLIWSYQDVLYFGRFEHPWAWLAFPLLSIAMYVFGYRFFRKIKPMFGNAL